MMLASRSERTIPRAGDSFQRAHEAFFGSAKAAAPPNVITAEFLRQKNEPLVRPAIEPNHHFGVVLSSKLEIQQLRHAARRLMQQEEPMLDPDFFLALVHKGWAPRVVAVYKGSDVVGLMYAKERIISGIPTGIVYADGSLGGFLLAKRRDQQTVFRVATEKLLASPAIRGVRLRVLRHGSESEAVREIIASRSLHAQHSVMECRPSHLWKDHAHLPLADSYEQFLNRLGSTTRHNFRYYRRRFEASGHTFLERLSMDELRSAAFDLSPQSKFTSRWGQIQIERDLEMVAAAWRPLAIGLKHHDGKWLSVVGGWYMQGGAVLCFQCNNEFEFGSDSLSTVLRAYLIESLIRERLQELVIWAGTGPPLSRYVSYPRTIGVHLDVPSHWWRLARLLISKIGPYLPTRLAAAVQWMD